MPGGCGGFRFGGGCVGGGAERSDPRRVELLSPENVEPEEVEDAFGFVTAFPGRGTSLLPLRVVSGGACGMIKAGCAKRKAKLGLCTWTTAAEKLE